MQKRGLLKGISTNIILLGLVSFLMDASSEMIMPILPLFITALGGTGLVIGLIGGLGKGVASFVKVFSGNWSDRLKKRKPLIFWGYTVSAVSKLFFPLAVIWQHLLVLRPIERVGKGLRDAPRDALISEYAKKKIRGKAFGIHRTLDTSGAVIGSALVLLLFWFLKLGFRQLLFIAAGIAFLSLIPLIFVKEKAKKPKKVSLKLGLKALPKPLRGYIAIATLFALGNFTYMFLILRAGQFFSLGLAIAIPLLLYVLYNIIYAAFSIPSGILSDKIGRKNVLAIGYSFFGLTCVGFIFARSLATLIPLFCLYGLFFAFVEGNQRAFAADLAPKQLKGTALGSFHFAIGIAALPAGLIAGALWLIAPEATFIYGAVIGFLAALLIVRTRK